MASAVRPQEPPNQLGSRNLTDQLPLGSVGKPSAHARQLFIGGLIATATYVGALGIYAYVVRRAMLDMTPDEFATFLAGIFAPLAFLWLVLGFRQQGDELQNSARALWLQGEELRNSVEQQRQLVEVSKEQLAAGYAEQVREEEAADRKAQPRFVASSGGSYSGKARTLTFAVTSAGPTCSSVSMLINGVQATTRHILPATERIAYQRRYQSPEDVEAVDLQIHYTDERGNRRSQSFSYPVNEQGGPNRDRTLDEPIPMPGYEKLETSLPTPKKE